MKVSFLVTYYNQREFVRRSLDGIAALNLPFPYEILVGDDGSDDGTQEEVRAYMGQHPERPITLHVMPRDPGKREKSIIRASANRIHLLRHAKGAFFLSLDGDDCYCDREFVRESVERLESDESLAGCAYSTKMITDSGETTVSALPVETASILETKEYLVRGFWCHSGAIVFRNVLDESRIREVEATGCFDDNILTIYMLKFGRLYYTPRPVYCYYCKNAGSLMNGFRKNELHFLQNMDWEILSKLIPRCRNQIRTRQWGSIRHIWAHRNELMDFPAEDLETYRNWNRKLDNDWCLRMLNWGTDPRLARIRTTLRYGIMTIQRYAGNFSYALRHRIKRILP